MKRIILSYIFLIIVIIPVCGDTNSNTSNELNINNSYNNLTVTDYMNEKFNEFFKFFTFKKININIFNDLNLTFSSESTHEKVINSIPLLLTIIIVFITVILITYVLMFENLFLSAIIATLLILLITIYKGIPFLNIVNHLNIDAIIGAFILSVVTLILTYLLGRLKNDKQHKHNQYS